MAWLIRRGDEFGPYLNDSCTFTHYPENAKQFDSEFAAKIWAAGQIREESLGLYKVVKLRLATDIFETLGD